jgi:hypothetical protein
MGRVFYVTNRMPDNTAAPTSYGIDFNGQIPGSLTYGIADVTAPPGHGPTGLPNEATTQQAVQISDPSAGDFSAATTPSRRVSAWLPVSLLGIDGPRRLSVALVQ